MPGIRRSEPDHPPTGTAVGSTTITQPIQPDPLDPGYIPGTSNPAMKPGPWHDTAEVAKPNKPSGEHVVFDNLRSK